MVPSHGIVFTLVPHRRWPVGGAHVLLLARDRERLPAVALAIRTQGGRADVYPVDLSDPNAVAAVAKAVLKDTRAPAILVNNAGAGRWLSVLETSRDERLPGIAAKARTLTPEEVGAAIASGIARN